MRRPLLLVILASTLLPSPLTTSSVLAAPKKAVRKKTAKVAKPEPVEPAPVRVPGSMMNPLAVKLRPTTPAEAQANAVWNVRAALNIAALQCQFSPFLATVRNYNDLLRQHSDELDRARQTMVAHFRRYDGARAQNSFDQYTSRTYNSYSTLDAQLSFCEGAAAVGREALTVKKGALGTVALRLSDQVRASLTPVAALSLLTPFEIAPDDLPPF
ncbi:MAG: hypothetical protein ACRYG4_08115 [Janthinobacterium lividum]